MRLRVTFACLAAMVVTACDEETTAPQYQVTVDPADFVAQIDNPYLPLTPGTVFRYEGNSEDGHETNIVTVTNQTYTILGVACTAVEDTVLVDGALVEATTDWYAQDQDGNVWYFGEASKDFENGVVVSTEGSWQAGQRGAQPGIIMFADPQVGTTYYQEFEKEVAEDQGHVVSRDAQIAVPYGAYDSCVEIEEWSDLEPGIVEYKIYARDVGVVYEATVVGGNDISELVSVTSP